MPGGPGDDELESIEILSAMYRPTTSILLDPNYLDSINPQSSDHLMTRTNHHLPAIRSVDDYEKGNMYYFRPDTGPTSSRDRLEPGRGRSSSRSRRLLPIGQTEAPTDPTLITVPIYNGDMVLLDTSCSIVKKPLTADERKRKRITLAIGIMAGRTLRSKW